MKKFHIMNMKNVCNYGVRMVSPCDQANRICGGDGMMGIASNIYFFFVAVMV
jgi:hypothetical protein